MRTGKIDSLQGLGELAEGGLPSKSNGVEVEGTKARPQSPGDMPGLLKRSHDRIVDDNEDPDAGTPEKKRLMVNGDAASSSGSARPENGFPENGSFPQDLELARSLDLAVASKEPPPIHHITQGFVPLTTLINRASQECFNELDQVINDLAELQSRQVNGYGSSQSSQMMIQKKERLFNFAQGCRKKFVSLLILSQWSRKSDAVSKVIDVNQWNFHQRGLYRDATSWLGELKRLLVPAKLPAPDLKTTLEVLSTGKAEWFPHVSLQNLEFCYSC